jgi:heat shock protein HtpX
LLSFLPFSPLFAVVAAIVPAVVRWWWSRALTPLVNDLAFPERLAAYRVRSGQAVGVGLVLLVVGFTSTLYWSVPLLILSCTMAGHRLRRVIYRETWSLGAYISFLGRASLAFFGFWILLASAPAIASYAGARDWIVAIVLAVVLLAWNQWSSNSVRLLLRTRPIPNPELLQKFVTLAQATTAGMPRFEQVELHGGAIANAIALASRGRSSVIFTDSLLSRLEEREIVAICGHELAHLEHFNRQYLRTHNLINLALIAGTLVTVALARFFTFLSPVVFWPLVVLMTMAWRVRDRQQHETESDLRAVALTGDPEALASGLTKIHAYAHVPRRMDAEREQQSTHPSLARRIKAIRALTPTAAPAAVTTTATFVSTDERTQVTFADHRLEWREGDAALHSLSYAHLREMRLAAGPSGSMRLIVVETLGRRWEMPVKETDIAAVQATLDLVDGRLAEPAKAVGPWPTVRRVFTVVAISVSCMTGQFSAILVALLAIIRPSPPLVAAAGAATLAAAALSQRNPIWSVLDGEGWILPTAVVMGLFLLWSAWNSRHEKATTAVTRLVTAIGGLSALAVVGVLTSGSDMLRLHQSARGISGATIWPIAFGAAMITYGSVRARVLAVAALLAGITVATAGSLAFLDRFATDPFLLPSDALKQTHVTGVPAHEFAIPFYATDVRLSPGGALVAARNSRDDGRDDRPSTFHVGRHGGTLSTVTGDDLVFLDDDHALVIAEADGGTTVEELSLSDTPVVMWKQHVPTVVSAQLTVRGRTQEWRLLGWDRSRNIVRATGTIGQEGVTVTRWAPPSDRRMWNASVAVSGEDALLVETRYDETLFETANLWRAFTMFPTATVSQLWRISQSGHRDLGTTRIATHCFPEALGDDRLVCSAFDGTRTRLLVLDPATGAISALGTVDGMFASYERSPTGWLTGWCNSTPVALRLATREVVAASGREPGFVGFATGERFVGTITSTGASSTIRVFPM